MLTAFGAARVTSRKIRLREQFAVVSSMQLFNPVSCMIRYFVERCDSVKISFAEIYFKKMSSIEPMDAGGYLARRPMKNKIIQNAGRRLGTQEGAHHGT